MYKLNLLVFGSILLVLFFSGCSSRSGDLNGSERNYREWQGLFSQAQELANSGEQLELAQSKVEQAIKIVEQDFAVDSYQYQLSLVSSLSLYGRILVLRGDLDQAVSIYQRAVIEAKKAYGADHVSVSDALRDLGLVHLKRGEIRSAQECFEQSLEINLRLFGNSHPFVVEDYLWLAETYYELNRPQQASLLGLKGLFNLVINRELPAAKLGRLFLLQARALTHSGADEQAGHLFREAARIFMSEVDNTAALERVENGVRVWADQSADQGKLRSFKEWVKQQGGVRSAYSGVEMDLSALVESYFLVWRGLEKYRSIQHGGLEGLLRSFSAYFQDLALAYQREANWDRMEFCLREAQEFRSRAQSLRGSIRP